MSKYKIIIFLYFLLLIPLVSNVYASTFDKPLQGKVIYLDPGHGGIDSGAIYNKIYEKDINLFLTNKLNEKLQDKGATIYLTRNKDKDLALSKRNRKRSDLINRAYLINKVKPDMYISIHLNCTTNKRWKGTQIFYNNKNKENKIIAENLTKYLREKTINVREPKENNTYYMYKNIYPPGVLIELGFLSNPDDRYRLTHEKYQDEIITNLVYSIEKYFKEKRKY